MPPTDSTGPVVHLYGLTGLEKASCESRLGHLYQYACMVSQDSARVYKLLILTSDSCAIWNGFHKSVTYGEHSIDYNQLYLSFKLLVVYRSISDYSTN